MEDLLAKLLKSTYCDRERICRRKEKRGEGKREGKGIYYYFCINLDKNGRCYCYMTLISCHIVILFVSDILSVKKHFAKWGCISPCFHHFELKRKLLSCLVKNKRIFLIFLSSFFFSSPGVGLTLLVKQVSQQEVGVFWLRCLWCYLLVLLLFDPFITFLMMKNKTINKERGEFLLANQRKIVSCKNGSPN